MDASGSKPSQLEVDNPPGLAAVQTLILGLGKHDSDFLYRAVASLLEAAPDVLRPIAVLTLADVLGAPADERTVQFAAALQCVVAATVVHRAGLHGGPDHLEVLAGDYLYAQAAVLTAGLDSLSIMAGLSGAIKSLCVTALNQPGVQDLQPLFELGAQAVTQLLGVDTARGKAVHSYGRLLDNSTSPTGRSIPASAVRLCIEQIASGEAAERLQILAHRVAHSVPTAAAISSVTAFAAGSE